VSGNNTATYLYASQILILELVKFIFYLLVPIKNATVFIRALLRKLCNTNVPLVYQLTVLSLGTQTKKNDAYFVPLLASLEYEVNYIKIVGGLTIKSTHYSFAESSLELMQLASLLLMLVVSPLLNIWYLLGSARKILPARQKFIYVYLGLKEINSGAVFSNKVITESISAYIKKNPSLTLLYPMEGRNWEKVMLSALSLVKGRSIGYIHAAITPRHLSLTSSHYYHPEALPSLIITPSEMAYALVSTAFNQVEVKKGFFLRGSKATHLGNKSSTTLLFALTGNLQESKLIMQAIAKAKSVSTYNVLVRLNPNTSTYKSLIEFATHLKLNLWIEKDNLIPTICFFRSSSVAIDYLKLDVLPVYLSLNEIISSNIFALDNKFEFQSIEVNEHFNNKLQMLINETLTHQFDNGGEVANYYLDQCYDYTQLSRLLN
ncbi:MAG: hypothetical protein H0W85_03570, partial [Methylotenera sp.]|nr:hypothetical protein [Methylotenera sp.]